MKLLCDADVPLEMPFGMGAGGSARISHALAYCNSAELYRRQMTPSGLMSGMAPRRPRAVQTYPLVPPIFQALLETGTIPASPVRSKRQPHSIFSKLHAACTISPAHYAAVISSAREGGTPAGGRFELVLNYNFGDFRGRQSADLIHQFANDSRAIAARMSLCAVESLSPSRPISDISEPEDGPQAEARAASRALIGVPAAIIADLKVAMIKAAFKIIELTIFQRQLNWSHSSELAVSTGGTQLSLADREWIAWLLISANSLLTHSMPKHHFALQHYNLVCKTCGYDSWANLFTHWMPDLLFFCTDR